MSEIIAKVVCPLPFTTIDLTASGHYSLCCESEPSQMTANAQTASQWFHGTEMTETRKLMSQGVLPLVCRSCFQKEALGLSSKRLVSKDQVEAGHFGPQFDLWQNPEVRFVSYRFGNACNLNCLMCNPEASTAYGREAEALGEAKYQQITNPFSLTNHDLKQVRKLYLGGGEPSMSKECFDLLDRLIALDHTNLAISLNSNCSLPHSPLFDKLTKFRDVYLGMSIDGAGETYDLIRYPMTWTKLNQHIEILFNKYPLFNFGILYTLSNLNLPNLGEFCQWWLELGRRSHRRITLECNDLSSPEFLSPRLCTAHQIANALSNLAGLTELAEGEDQRRDLDHFARRLESLSATGPNPEMATRLESFLERRRLYRRDRATAAFNSSP